MTSIEYLGHAHGGWPGGPGWGVTPQHQPLPAYVVHPLVTNFLQDLILPALLVVGALQYGGNPFKSAKTAKSVCVCGAKLKENKLYCIKCGIKVV